MSKPPVPVENALVQFIIARDWNRVIKRCWEKPSEVRSWTHCPPGYFENNGEADVLPIHLACFLSPPRDVISALHERYPHSLLVKEFNKHRLPLHIACKSGKSSLEMLLYLIHENPQAAAEEDETGRLPIHYALSKEAPNEIICALLEACPAGCRAYDRQGWLPIHVACGVGLSPSIIEKMLKEFPESVCLANNRGETPLACAHLNKQSSFFLQTVELLKKAEQNMKSTPRYPKEPSSLRLIV